MEKAKSANVFVPVKAPAGNGPTSNERTALITLYSQQRYAEVERMAAAMTVRFPQHSLAWKVLGAVLRQQGRTQDALKPMQRAAALAPADYEAWNNLGVTLNALTRRADAVACYQHALKIKSDFPEALGNLGDVLRALGRADEALACYRRKLELVPDDGEVAHHIDALTGRNTARAPDEYVAKVFDAYADNFDAHLQETLQYQVPRKLAQLVEKHMVLDAPSWRALDLGCGTGLVGEALIALNPCQLVGVDLSAQMLDKARSKTIYERLEQAELLAMMQQEPDAAYDLVIAGDVFVYLGRLDEVAAESKRLLRPGGAFVFTVETLQAKADQEGEESSGMLSYELLSSGRYAHADSYLLGLAEGVGFNVVEVSHTTLRQDQDGPIAGTLSYWRA